MKRKANAKLDRPMNPDSRLTTVPVKLSVDEARDLDKKALAFASGKRSTYIRAALLNYRPKKEDFT